MKTSTKQVKTVTVLARITYKSDPRKVVYKVLSSDGVTKYNVYVFNGQVSGCECPSKTKCYHKDQIQQREDARKTAEATVLGVAMTNRELAIESAIRDYRGAFVTAAQVLAQRALSTYDVQQDANIVAAFADALPLDAYEVLATTKHTVNFCSECGKLSKSGLCGDCVWGC